MAESMGDKDSLASVLGSPGIRKRICQGPSLSLPIISVKVGLDDESETFGVHKSLLVSSSNFLRAALKEPWEESKGLVELPKEDPALFEVYVQYLYCGKIFSTLDTSPIDESDVEWVSLQDLYILGDRLQDECFRNSVIDALEDKCSKDNKYPIGLADKTYANTAPGSPLRRLLVDLHVWAGSGECFKGEKENGEATCDRSEKEKHKSDDVMNGPREFLLDFIAAFIDAGADLYSKKQKLWMKDSCAYHEHKDTPACKK